MKLSIFFASSCKVSMLESDRCTKEPMEPMTKAKTPQERIIEKMHNTFSSDVIGTISPYPTVVIVIIAQ